MRAMIKSLVVWAAMLSGARASAEGFDYYLLALSWSPSWCAAQGRAEGAEQCARDPAPGFVLHGLWPQYEQGWPEYCDTAAGDPSRRQTAAMADVMGSGGLAWYQWKKHGRCSGMEAAAYFDAARAALGALTLPELPGEATASAIETAILAANPALGPAQLIVTCREGRLAEVRLCLDRAFAPRACAADVARDACRAGSKLDVPQP